MSVSPLTIVVTGPTCGGKTGLSTEIARRFGWPILSLDSMKIYRGMDIGAAKPSPLLQSELRFELIDLRDPQESFSASDYLEEWKRVSASIEGPRLVSGGTVFYLNALREGLFEGPGPDPDVRQRLEEEATRVGPGALHERLQRVDPIAGARIHPTDQRRTLRALEVFEQTGETMTVWQGRRSPVLDPARTWLLGVFRPRAELHRRIEERVVRMFEAGWVDEVVGLIARNDPPWSRAAAQSIGYERIRQALKEGRDPEEEIPNIQVRTRGLARNQLTWVRKMPVEWWRVEEREELLAALASAVAADALPSEDRERRARKTEV